MLFSVPFYLEVGGGGVGSLRAQACYLIIIYHQLCSYASLVWGKYIIIQFILNLSSLSNPIAQWKEVWGGLPVTNYSSLLDGQ